MLILPLNSNVSPSSVFKRVDFPQPTGPVIAVIEDFGMLILISLNTGAFAWCPKVAFCISNALCDGIEFEASVEGEFGLAFDSISRFWRE